MGTEKQGATPAERARLKKALKGGVFFPIGKMEALKGMESGTDFTLTRVCVEECWAPWTRGDRGNLGGMTIAWETKGSGWGVVTLIKQHDGKLRIDNEAMSREFIMEILKKLVDEAILEDDEPKKPDA